MRGGRRSSGRVGSMSRARVVGSGMTLAMVKASMERNRSLLKTLRSTLPMIPGTLPVFEYCQKAQGWLVSEPVGFQAP